MAGQKQMHVLKKSEENGSCQTLKVKERETCEPYVDHKPVFKFIDTKQKSSKQLSEDLGGKGFSHKKT